MEEIQHSSWIHDGYSSDEDSYKVNMKRAREGLNEELQCKSSKSKTDEALRKISINTRLAAEILLSEANKGSCGKNVVCSPLSLEFAMHMVAAGSKGETLSQILEFIGSKVSNPLESMEDLNLKSLGLMRVTSSFYKSDIKKAREDDWDAMEEPEKEPELLFANGVWVDHRYKLKPSYKELMNSIYNARAETINFEEQSKQICKDVNSWVAEKTKGLIKQMLNSIGRDVMMILVNALCFKGAWSYPFNEKITKDKDFHLLDGTKVSVPFMLKFSNSYYFRAFDGFRVVKLGYQRGEDKQRQFSMLILLPDEKDGLNDLVRKCVSDPEFLNQDFGLKLERFDYLWIPKFKFSYKIEDVSKKMKELGLTLPFMRGNKDFTEIVELKIEDSIWVSKIIHKATIDIDESGTEAAAATVVTLCSPGYSPYDASPPPPPGIRFKADHPFIFIIKEEITGANFFVGTVFNPQEGDCSN